MEAWFRSVLLNSAALILMTVALTVRSETSDEIPELDDLQEFESVIQPEIKRTTFDESKIESQTIELIPTLSIFSIEDFGANIMLGIKAHYHATEDVFVGIEYGQSEAGKTSYEILSSGGAPLLNDDQRTYSYYMFTMGYNLLPGEAFFTDNITYNSALYLTAGLGSVDFGGNTNVVLAFGAGYRLLMSDFSSIYLEMRDHAFNSDIIGIDKLTHNLEFGFGYSFYF
ncbi:MAG: outer membrane beta-barrel domain-containing protein [Gammaproteobacteria bacterium]